MGHFHKMILSTSAVFALASAAQAQVTSTGGAATGSATTTKSNAAEGALDDQSRTEQDIIVTAERRASTTADTAISMAAISGKNLRENGLSRVADLQKAVPSLVVSTAGAFNYINIRGIGNAVSLAGTTTGVAVFHDGLFEPDASGLGTGFFDIANVEVLRGPQGTFVGQSSTGGALLIKSRDPDLSDVGGYIDGEYGRYDRTKLEGAINLPISSTLAARAAFLIDRRDSYYTNLGSGRTPGDINDQAIRLSLLWRPSASFQTVLKAEITRTRNDGTASAPIENTFVDPASGAVLHAGFWFASTHEPFTISYNFDGTYVHEERARISLDSSYTFDSGIVLRSVTGYQYSSLDESVDADATPLPVLEVRNAIAPKRYYSEDLILLSPTGERLNWILGASAFYRTSLNSTFVNGMQVADNPITTRRLALYGQAGFKVTPQLEVQGGLRINNDRNSDENRIFGLKGIYKDDNVTGKIGVNWTPSHDQLVYAFYARGYKSGGVNVGQPDFRAEYVDDYEIGWKGGILENKVRFELGAYYMNFKNMQIQAVNLATGANNGVGNLTGGSIVKGVDATVNGRFGDLRLDLSASYNKSRLGSATLVALYALPPNASNVPQCPLDPTTGACSGPGFDYTPYLVNVAGSRNPYAPEWTVSTSASYSIHVGDIVVRPGIRYTHIDAQYGSVYQADDYYLLKSRDLIDVTLTVEAGRWTVEGYGRNLTNRTYIQGLFQGPVGLTAYNGAPREYGIRIARSF